ncbi:MAG: hypothetical protein DMG04_11715 [Acidobacteria bacterium]|nr:MAG: hypothetical protein DMG04_11715 [Acidobacteriota bacterium]
MSGACVDTDLIWLNSVSFWMRRLRAIITSSFSLFSRASTMFCLSSRDSAFCRSRYSASPRSLSCTFCCCLSSSLSSQSIMFSVLWSLTCRF